MLEGRKARGNKECDIPKVQHSNNKLLFPCFYMAFPTRLSSDLLNTIQLFLSSTLQASFMGIIKILCKKGRCPFPFPSCIKVTNSIARNTKYTSHKYDPSSSRISTPRDISPFHIPKIS